MSLARTMFKNTFWLGISQFIQVALAAIIGIMLARYLGAVDYGKYTFAISFTALFGMLVDFGFSTYLINEIARDKSRLNTYLGNILSLKIIISSVFFILLYILLAFSGKPFDVKLLVYVSGLTLIFNSFSVLFYAIFRAHEKMEIEAFFTSTFALINFIFVVLAIIFKLDLLKILLVSFFVSIFGIIVVFVFVKKKVTKVELKKELPFWKKLLKDITPFLLSGIFISIYFYIPQVMLSFMKGDEVTGWYGATYKILSVIIAIIGVYFGVFFPVASRLFKEDKIKLNLLVCATTRIGFLFFLPLAFYITVFAKRIVLLVFGTTFLGSVSALQILVWASVLIFFGTTLSHTLLACLERRIYTIGVGIGALVNILSNLILIPIYSLNGSALSTILTELFVLLYMMYFFNKKISPLSFIVYTIKPIFALSIMGLLFYLLATLNINAFFVIIATFVLYIFIILLTKAVTLNELLTFKNIIFSKNC